MFSYSNNKNTHPLGFVSFSIIKAIKITQILKYEITITYVKVLKKTFRLKIVKQTWKKLFGGEILTVQSTFPLDRH